MNWQLARDSHYFSSYTEISSQQVKQTNRKIKLISIIFEFNISETLEIPKISQGKKGLWDDLFKKNINRCLALKIISVVVHRFYFLLHCFSYMVPFSISMFHDKLYSFVFLRKKRTHLFLWNQQLRNNIVRAFINILNKFGI